MTLKRKILIIALSILLTLSVASFVVIKAPKAKAAVGDSVSYTADFSDGLPSDWTESSFGEYNVNGWAKTANGVRVGHGANAAWPDESNYYGAFYKIAQSIGNVSDFTLQMTFTPLERSADDRWFGVLYRTQNEENGKVSGYMMNYRFNGNSAGSAITNAPIFNDTAVAVGTTLANNTSHTLKIVVSGKTATHYMDNVQLMTINLETQLSAKGTAFSNILGGTYSQGGFALIVNKSYLDITALTITGTKGTPNQNNSEVNLGDTMQYYADFKNGLPSDWSLNNKSDTANVITPTKVSGSAVGAVSNGLQLQHQNSGLGVYYGSMYDIATNLGNVRDFTLELRYRVTAYVENTNRWIGVLYHTQKDSNGYTSAYGMNYRYVGASAETAISGSSSGISFSDGTKIEGLVGHDGTQYHTLKIVVNNGTATHYVDKTQIVTYELSDKMGIMGQTLLEGGFALIVNGCTIQIDSLTIVGTKGNDVAQAIKSAPTYMNVAPAIVFEADSVADYNAINNSKADSVILTANENLQIVDANGLVIDTLSNGISTVRLYAAVPVIRVKTAVAGNAVATYLNTNSYKDISVMANDTALVKSMRDIAPYVRGMVDWSSSNVANNESAWQTIIAETNKAKANVAVLSKSQATFEAVTYIQERLKTVWTVAGDYSEFDTIELAVRGTFGIITGEPANVYNAYSKFSNEQLALLRAPLNIAHRGLSNHCLENSLEGYKLAFDNYGASHLEVDAHLTKDNQLVMMHDDCLVRTTDYPNDCGYRATGYHWQSGYSSCTCCSDLTLAEIQQYNIIKTHEGTAPVIGKTSERIPSVDEVFNYFKDKDVVYAFEIKHSKNDDESVTAVVTALKALLDKYNNYHQVFVITFNKEVVKKMGSILPQVPVAVLSSRNGLVQLTTDGYGELAYLSCGDDGERKNLNSAESLKKRGYMPYFWTYNLQANIDDAFSHGCYGVTNNEPHLIEGYAERLELLENQKYMVSKFNGNALEDLEQPLRFYTYGNYYVDTKATVFATEKFTDYANVIFKSVYTTNTNKSYTIYSQPIKVIDENIYMSVNELNTLLAKDVALFDDYDKAKLQIVERAYAVLDASEQSLVVGMENLPLIREKLNEYTVTVVNDDNQGTVTGLTNPYLSGDSANISITAKLGYFISSITYDGGAISVTDQNAMTVNVQVTKNAQLVITYGQVSGTPSYQISLINDNTKGIVTGVTNGMTILEGSSLSFSVNALSGYYVQSVTYNGASLGVSANATSFAYTINSINSTGDLVVTYAEILVVTPPSTYTVNVIVDGTKGYVTGVTSGVNYNENTVLDQIKVVARDGYEILSIKWNNVSETITNKTQVTLSAKTITEDCTLIVTFERIDNPNEEPEPTTPNTNVESKGCSSSVSISAIPAIFVLAIVAMIICIKKSKKENN